MATVFNTQNKAIAQVLVLDRDPVDYPDDYIKYVVFIDTKKFKYHPFFTHIYARSPDGSEIFIDTLVDVLEQNKEKMYDEAYRNSLINNLIKTFNVQNPAIFNDLIAYTFEPRPRTNVFESKILSTLGQYVSLVSNYFTEEPRRKPVSDDWSKASSIDTAYSVPDSQSSAPVKFLRVKEKTTRTKVVSYILKLTKPAADDLVLEDLYRSAELGGEKSKDDKMLAIGMIIDGSPKYRQITEGNRKVLRKIDEFIMSEHKLGKAKVIEPFKIYFLYRNNKDYFYGQISSKGVVSIKVKPHGDVSEEEFQEHVRGSIKEARKILKLFDELPGALSEIIPDDISIKVVSNSGFFKNDFMIKQFKGTLNKTIVYFSFSDTLKNILYSPRDNLANFTFSGLLQTQIPEAIKSVEYLLKQHESKLVIRKKKAGEDGYEVPINARECIKERRPRLLGKDKVPEGVHTMNYQGRTIVCNKDYPWPGFTKKSGIPCCFKKEKVIDKPVSTPRDSLQDSEVIDKIAKEHKLQRDTNEMERYRMGKVSNPVLSKIFGDYYSLSPGKKSSLLDALKFVYGKNILPDSVEKITQKNFKQYISKDIPLDEWKADADKSEESVVKAVSIYKKINILVVFDKNPEAKIACSMTDFFSFDNYLILLRNEKTESVNVLVNESIKYELGYDLDEVQQFILTYNQSCHTAKKCDKQVYTLAQMARQKNITIISQVINSFNLVYYVETKEYGILPVLPSKINYSIPTKTIKQLTFLEKYKQYESLVALSKRIPYLEPVAYVLPPGEDKITAIEIYCGMFSPVADTGKELPDELPVSDGYFYPDMDDILKSNIISDSEMRVFLLNLEENYYNVAKRILKNYYFQEQNKGKKKHLFERIEQNKYNELIDEIGSLFIRDRSDIEKGVMPVEETVPMKMNDRVFDNVVSKIVWALINEGPLFFNEKRKKKNRVNVQFIPIDEEIEITAAV